MICCHKKERNKNVKEIETENKNSPAQYTHTYTTTHKHKHTHRDTPTHTNIHTHTYMHTPAGAPLTLIYVAAWGVRKAIGSYNKSGSGIFGDGETNFTEMKTRRPPFFLFVEIGSTDPSAVQGLHW